jgi:hypothetical protein
MQRARRLPATTPPGVEEFPVDYVIEPAFLAASLFMLISYAIHFYFCRMYATSEHRTPSSPT